MKLQITVEGKRYEVEVEIMDREGPGTGLAAAAATRVGGGPVPVAAPAAGGGIAVADEAKAIRSPLAGNVVKVSVQPGQDVTENETVIVLEAMKMETAVTTPTGAKVKIVHVAVGDAVKSGDPLLEFE